MTTTDSDKCEHNLTHCPECHVAAVQGDERGMRASATLLDIYAQQAAWTRKRYFDGKMRKGLYEIWGMTIFNNLADEGDRIARNAKENGEKVE